MSFIGLPPGNILQNLYLNERLDALLKNKQLKTFLEIGSGNGFVSRILLNNGMQGIGIDLNISACEHNQQYNAQYLSTKKYEVICDDFLHHHFSLTFDCIISYMVIEHLNFEERKKFIDKAKELLNPEGLMIFQVPAGMKYWNIEDEVAGHIIRYEKKDIENILNLHQLCLHHLAWLNYPLSNWLFGWSNFLIKKQEARKLNLSMQERTIESGHRKVKYKTTFPKIFNLLLNPVVLYPFHLLQKLFCKQQNALILYMEFTKQSIL